VQCIFADTDARIFNSLLPDFSRPITGLAVSGMLPEVDILVTLLHCSNYSYLFIFSIHPLGQLDTN